jgi:hypothetical protein
MTGDCHVRFCGSAGGRFPCATRYGLRVPRMHLVASELRDAMLYER